jgi:hypothetical protein
MPASTTTLTTLVVPLPGRQFDRWDLDPWPPSGRRGCPIGSRSGAEAWLFGSCAPRIRGAAVLSKLLCCKKTKKGPGASTRYVWFW